MIKKQPSNDVFLVMAHKVLNGKCQEHLQDKSTKRCQVSSYSARNSQDLHLPKPRLEFTKNSFQFTEAFYLERDTTTIQKQLLFQSLQNGN